MFDIEALLAWAWRKCDGDYTEYARVLRMLGYGDDLLRAEFVDNFGLSEDEFKAVLKEST